MAAKTKEREVLTKDERKELIQLAVRCFDKDGTTVLPDATEKELTRLQELMAKSAPEPAVGISPILKLKHFTMSEKGKQLVADGAEFQGVEVRNHGTDDKPVLVLREWFYVGAKGDPDRHCCFIQYPQGQSGNAREVTAGRTISEAGLRRFQR